MVVDDPQLVVALVGVGREAVIGRRVGNGVQRGADDRSALSPSGFAPRSASAIVRPYSMPTSVDLLRPFAFERRAVEAFVAVRAVDVDVDNES